CHIRDPAHGALYTLSLHDALPIFVGVPALHAPHGIGCHRATASSASSRVNALAYRALPTMAPSTPSGTWPAMARRSSSEETPPEATTGRSVAAHTFFSSSRLGPWRVPSLAMSVTT